MTFGRHRWIVRHWTDDYAVLIDPRPITEAMRRDTERALGVLLWAYMKNEPDVAPEIDRLHRVLFSFGGQVRSLFGQTAIAERAHQERVRRDLEHAARAGRLAFVVATRPIGKVQRTQRVGGVVAPGLSPAAEAAPTFFEARLVDEVGEPISGLDVVVTAEGRPHQLTTDGAGKVRLDGVQASRANLRVASLRSLRDILEPRWSTARAGSLPVAEPIIQTPLTDDLGAISLESEVEHLIVIVPPLGKIFLELLDRAGRIRHANRDYTIDGPMKFSGKTDENGTLLHEGVLPGDYVLTLSLEGHEPKLSALVLHPPSDAQVRLVGAVPRVERARLTGFFFDTNKSFLLPAAISVLDEFAEIFESNNPSELLIVGHTDTTGEPAINDPLSLERADNMAAFLRREVDAWLRMYEPSIPAARRWGSPEDEHMLLALPDFSEKPPRDDSVRWFQRTRGLTVDGISGPKTRRQLVTEYMGLSSLSLAESFFDIAVTTHGCGENFPIDAETGEADAAPTDQTEDQADRRVELFFFDREFGIDPAPPGKNSGSGSTEYPKWVENSILVGDESSETAGVFSVLLTDDKGEPIPEAICGVLSGAPLTTLRADGEGFIRIKPDQGASSCLLEWRKSEADPSFAFRREVFIEIGSGTDGLVRRLHNLGYATGASLEDDVLAFQHEFAREETGRVEDIEADLVAWHDDGVRPAPGQPPPEARDAIAFNGPVDAPDLSDDAGATALAYSGFQ